MCGRLCVYVVEKLQTLSLCRSVFCVLSDWLAVCPGIIKLWLDIRRIIGHKSNLPIPRVHAEHDTPDGVTDTVSHSQSCTEKNEYYFYKILNLLKSLNCLEDS